ncbi:hypothetical protein [Pedobacter frigoris]|uniref:hypothetical protein n=1 Tax=Pedobacter frigoris TaxID=2571272 RepID=UPI00292D674A|nr:hypothetical protein [Pedobacter frigoris]
MKLTMKLVVMAALCFNFCYGQTKKACPKSGTTRTHIYAFTGYKSGYKRSCRVSADEFMRGKMITVRNYTIPQLYAIALRLAPPNDASFKAGEQEKVIIDVRQPEKLKRLYCYKLVVPYNHQDDFYILMHRSLDGEWPEYEVKMEKKGKEYFMVIRDKEQEL